MDGYRLNERLVGLVILAGFVLGFAGQAQAAGWYNTDWGYRKKITIDHTKVNADLTNFAILYKITDPDLKDTNNGGNVGQSDGGDILFTKSDGTTKLDHEIEEYNPLTGELVAWVEIDSLSSTTDTEIYIYYGNSTCADQWNTNGPYESSLKMVQHLKETSGTHYDSTSNNNDGTPEGGLNQNADGQINGADSFDGTDDYVEVSDSASLDITDALTIEAWMNPSADGWNYKKPITLSPATPETDYQVKIELTISNFDYSKAKADGGDLRFYQADGTELSYWIETWNTSGTSIIWVKVATSGTDTIYMYYGNPSASSVSNGTNTFEFFDDFEDNSIDSSKWTEIGTPTETGGELTTNHYSSGYGDITEGVKSTPISHPTVTIEWRMKDYGRYKGVCYSETGIKVHWYTGTMEKGISIYLTAGTIVADGYDTARHPNILGSSDDNYHTYKMAWDGYNARYSVDGGAETVQAFSFSPSNWRIGIGNDGYSSDVTQDVSWIRVRKYASPEPSTTVGNETATGISKVGAYGIGANTTHAFASINNQTISASISSGWNHIVLTYDKDAGGTDEIKLYVNGVQASSADYSTAISTNSNNLLIGDLFNGTIDEVRIYNRALSAEEISTQYNNQNSPSTFYSAGSEVGKDDTFTWDGSSSTDWDTAVNWDRNDVPASTHSVVIPSAPANQPVLASNTRIANLTINSGASLSLSGNNLTVSNTLTNEGSLQLYGSETLSIGTMDTDSGTVTYVGDGDGTAETFTIEDFGSGNDYYNLTINDANVTKDTFQTSANLTVAGALNVTGGTLDISTNANTLTTTGTLTVSGGTLDGLNGTIDANGAVTITGGELIAPSGNFNVAGDFAHSAGTFTHSSGTVVFDGAGQTTVSGDATFYNLTSTTAGKQINFTAGTTQTVTGALTLTGASGNLIILRSTSTDTQWNIDPQGTRNVSYVDVKDSNNINSTAIVANNSINSGNNTNWSFGKNFSGTVYIDEGTTNIGANKTVAISVNGAAAAKTAETDANGHYSFSSVEVSDGDVIIVYLDNEIEKAATVSVVTNADLSGLDLYQNRVIVRHDYTTGYTTNANLATADNGDTDIKYSVSSNNLTLESGQELFIWSGDTYQPGGNVTTADLDIRGTVIAGANTFNISGNFSNAGTFTYNTSTLNFNGTSAQTINPGSSEVYNLTINNSGATDTVTVNTNALIVNGMTTITDGQLVLTQNVTFKDNVSVFSNGTLKCETAGKTLTFGAAKTVTQQGTFTITGTSASKINLRSTTSGIQWKISSSGINNISGADVKDSDASGGNAIVAYNSTNSGNNANWVFNTVAITSPTAGKTVGTTPVVIGTAGPSDTVIIKDKDGTQVATTTADANGNFRVALSAALATGANSLIPYVGAISGTTINTTVVAAPTTGQVPTITSPAEGQRISGATATITGKGLAGQSVSIKANDANGNLLLQEVGSGTVDASGNYSITLTTALPKGKNYLTVTVDGVTSDIRTVTLTDPFGVVFDSLTNNPIEGAVVTIFNSDGSQCTPGVEIDAGDTNPQTTGADGTYSFLCADGNYYITITASGYAYPSARTSFPAGRTIVTGSKGEVFTVAGAVIEMDHPMDANTLLLKIKKDANKKEVVVGDVVTYTVTIKNETASDVTNVYLEDKIPAGFKYISGKAILDNTPIPDPTGNRPIVFDIGTLNAGTTRTLKYQLVVGSGVTLGNYENTAHAKYSDGTVISNQASETVKIIPDPLFDLGTIIGKVFWDWDEDGVQKSEDRRQRSEVGIPNVQIVMEDGTVVTTDKDGKYHLPAVIPGRHLLRLDERTLPEGAYLTTDKAVIVDITPGILAKVNFGVNSKDSDRKAEISNQKLGVKILQERTKPQPRLNAACYLQDNQYEFRIFTNYSLFIEKWKLEILDKDTKALVKEFAGTRLTINKPILWDGKNKNGKSLREDRNYIYILTVTGRNGRQDATKERELKVTSHQSQVTSYEEKEKSDKEKEADYKEWIQQESRVNNLDKQNIRIEGETVLVHNPQSIVRSIRIKKGEKIEQEILLEQPQEFKPSQILKSPQRLEGTQAKAITEIILPKGEYDIEIIGEPVGGLTGERGSQLIGEQQANSQTGKPAKQTYTQHIKVGEDYLFFVAMGDAKLGYTFNRGNIEPVQQDDKFKKGFWSEGKLAYYLKGKIKGKYLITSSLDTERDKKELFRNLDPDKYYPVYGDSSSIDYKATDTQGMLYLLVEWDKSSILWGNYETGFTDTEFASFSRTLYGGKVHLESVSTTQFGQPHTKLIVFRARAQQRAAHNEFIGTGGSLFYLKHSRLIEGSEKVKIEVRDKITGLVLATKELEEEFDYEIDYSNGRLTFWQPISYMVESDSIISSHLLDGNPVYVVVDYEYETKDKYDEGAYGLRAQQSLTDYLPSTFSKVLGLSIGGTYVKEEQLNRNYTLSGMDTILHLGKDIKFTAEFAESESEAAGSFISTDGGLSFTELPTGDLDKGKAYGLKSEAYLFDRLGLSGYYKRIEKGFSSATTVSQQGKELLGAGLTSDITPKTRLRATHDIQKLIDDGNPQTQLQVGAQKTETSSVQITHQMEKLKLTGEYRHQKVQEKLEQFESETNTEEDTVAVRADYKLTEKIDVSLEQQATLKGAANHQTSIGVNAQVNEYLSLRAKETVGTQGTATTIGATSKVKDKFEISGDYTKTNYKTGEVGDTASLSGRAKIDDKTEVHTTLAVTDTSAGAKTQSIVFGSERKINEQLTLTTDRTYAKSRDKLTQANTFGLVREKDGRRLEGAFTEQRSQSDTEVSCTNIFGLSGDINDKWAAGVSFERGKVQNHDGALSTRNAGSIGLGFVDKDKETGEVRLKASSKLELRLDDGEVDKRQYLIYNAIEGKINPNTTLFAKANISQTKNTTTDSTEAQYKELITGIAYRPVNFDRLNLLAKYTYLEDNSPSGQSNFSDIEKEKSHILAAEAVYDLTDKWQLVEKLAYKQGEEKVAGFEFTKTQTWLLINRINYDINKDWQIGAEYRRLTQKQAEDVKQGALVEVSRNIGDFIQVGAGYNFTDFNDDLTHLDYTAQGPFIRLTGKFYDRTPEEIERARQIWLEERIKQWAWELVQDGLAKPDSPIMQELYRLYYLAKEFENKGKLNPATECYQRSLQIGRMMYTEAEEYVRKRIELETRLKKEHQVALEYYRQGRLLEARELWQRIKQEAEPEPIIMEVQKCVIR